ncbi:MAG: hypothetical protein HN521_23870 [Candidatus Latescibacteria bacterium]|jgi:hypothetical protein|nr:hypothetical protein [Candidatus Latescibacterota bacterium]MBT5828863.1 hypothetical protein [Candidatus Latescibacterota bacterium]
MSQYRFSVIVSILLADHDKILDAVDVLGQVECTDASVRGHADGMEILFERVADSLQSAMSSAIFDVERAGFQVAKVELEREAIMV